MNYTEAVNYIHSLLKFGIRPGLTGMNTLLHYLGNPEKNLKFVHIAGTNGKGSTSTAISNVLADAGYNVGLYTSPYVTDFLERVQFNNKPVNKELFAKAVLNVKKCVEQCESEGVTITEFEALTAAAFLCFKELSCRIVCLEVGLGGKLDATNVIETPLVNVITSLSLDHIGVLGDTIEKIAFEKCGTIKENGTVISSCGQPEEALKVIKNTACEKNNTLIIPDEKDMKIIKSDLFGTCFIYKNEEYTVTLPGIHQLKNMTCVIEACEVLKKHFNISSENIKNGILKTTLPARVEVLCREPLTVLDGGHNEDGAKAFFEAIKPVLNSQKRVFVLVGMMGDKAVESSLKPLLSNAFKVFCVTPDNPRAMSSSQLCEISRKYCKNSVAFNSAGEGLKIALEEITRNDILFCVGSLYLAGEIRRDLIESLKKFG